MDQIETFLRTVDQTGAIVAGVKPDQMGASTPCVDFDLRALLNHTIAGIAMFDTAARGKPMDGAALGAYQVGDDPEAEYQAAAASMKEALKAPTVLDDIWNLPFGAMPGAFAIGVATVEALQHGWDIARSTGQSPAYDEELSTAALALAQMMPAEQVRTEGVFGPEAPCPDGTPVTDQLAAFLGRAI